MFAIIPKNSKKINYFFTFIINLLNGKVIRRIFPQGTSFDNLNQDDINLMMSHINSYKRKKLNNVSPITLFNTIYGSDTTDKLEIREINPNDINLTSDLLKK